MFAGERDLPGPEDLANVLTGGATRIDGASGAITIAEGGARETKEVPILQLHPDGISAFSEWVTVTSAQPGRK